MAYFWSVEELERSQHTHTNTSTFTQNHTQWTSVIHSYLLYWVCLSLYVFYCLEKNALVKSTFSIIVYWLEVGQRYFVHPQPLVLSDTLTRYHHMTAWLMEHAQQIRAGLFGYGLPDISTYARLHLCFSFVSADKSGIVPERWGMPCWTRLTGTTTWLCYQRKHEAKEKNSIFFVGTLIYLIV